MNPLSTDLGMMRQTLLFGGLESVSRNANRQNQNLRFFEFGIVIIIVLRRPTKNVLLRLTQKRCIWDFGLLENVLEGSWLHPDEQSSFYELNGYVQNIFARLGVPAGLLVYETSENNIFSYAMKVMNRGEKVVAELGYVADGILKNFGLNNQVFFAEPELDFYHEDGEQKRCWI